MRVATWGERDAGSTANPYSNRVRSAHRRSRRTASNCSCSRAAALRSLARSTCIRAQCSAAARLSSSLRGVQCGQWIRGRPIRRSSKVPPQVRQVLSFVVGSGTFHPRLRESLPNGWARVWTRPSEKTGVRPSSLWWQLGQSVTRFSKSKASPPSAMGSRWCTSSLPSAPHSVQRRPSRASTAARVLCQRAVERIKTPGSPAARRARDRFRSQRRHGPRRPSVAGSTVAPHRGQSRRIVTVSPAFRARLGGHDLPGSHRSPVSTGCGGRGSRCGRPPPLSPGPAG